MCLLAGFSLLFLGAAVWNLLHGDTENAVAGFIAGGVLMAFAIAGAREEGAAEQFAALLLENEEQLKAGGSIQYRGATVSAQTEVTQFEVCVSLLILTLKVPSRFYVRGSHKTIGLGFLYSLVSSVFGWWGFPWGAYLHGSGSL